MLKAGKKIGSSLFNGYKKFSFIKNKFLTHRYFINNYDRASKVYIADAERKIIFNNKECYFPKNNIDGKIEHNGFNNPYLFFDRKRYPLVKLPKPYDKSCDGNIIYAISDNQSTQKEGLGYKNFGFNKEDLKNKIPVIEINSSGEVVPIENDKPLLYSFTGCIKPISFRVADRKTGETKWMSSITLLPFNLGGATCNFACRIAGGMLNKTGGLFLSSAKRISKNLDDYITADKNGVLKSNKKLLRTRSIFTFIFESLASFFIATGAVVEGVGQITDSLLRTPNLIFNHDDLDRKATWANIKSSFITTYDDLVSVGKQTVLSQKLCNARLNCNIKETLDLKKDQSICISKSSNGEKKQPNQADESKVQEAAQGFSDAKHEPQIAVGSQNQLPQNASRLAAVRGQ